MATEDNIAKLAKDNNKLSSDVAELGKVIARNNSEVEKLKQDLVSQNKCRFFGTGTWSCKKSLKATKE